MYRELLLQKNYKEKSLRILAQAFMALYLKNKVKMEKEYPIVKIESYYCAFINSSDLIYVAVFSQEVNTLLVFSVLYTVVEVLRNSYKPIVNVDVVKKNSASICLMLDSYLHDGYPVVTQKYVLEAMVEPETMFDKIEEVLTGRSQHQSGNLQYLEKYAEAMNDARDYAAWRVPNIQEKDEIYFDLVEYIDAVIDKNGHVISQEINGEMRVESYLTGSPETNIYMSIPQPFDDYSLHESLFGSVRAFENEKLLNLVPPNGNYSLLFYSLRNQSGKLPFDLIHNIRKVGDKQLKVELKVERRMVKGTDYPIADFHIKLFFPDGLKYRENSPTIGMISVAESQNTILWRVGEIGQEDQVYKIVLTFDVTESYDEAFSYFLACLKFEIINFFISGTRIDKVAFREDSYQPVKKARNVVKSGYYEIRLS